MATRRNYNYPDYPDYPHYAANAFYAIECSATLRMYQE